MPAPTEALHAAAAALCAALDAEHWDAIPARLHPDALAMVQRSAKELLDFWERQARMSREEFAAQFEGALDEEEIERHWQAFDRERRLPNREVRAKFATVHSPDELRTLSSDQLLILWLQRMAEFRRVSLPGIGGAARRVLAAVLQTPERGHVVYAYRTSVHAGTHDEAVAMLSFTLHGGQWLLTTALPIPDIEMPGGSIDNWLYTMDDDEPE